MVVVLLIGSACFASYLATPPLALLTAAVVLAGLVSGGLMPVYSNLVAQRFGAASVGRAMGLSNLCLLPFGFGLPLVAGAMRDANGNYLSTAALCAAFLALGALFVFVSSRIEVPAAEAAAPTL